MPKVYKAEFFRRNDFSLADVKIIVGMEMQYDYLTLDETTIQFSEMPQADLGDYVRISPVYGAGKRYDGVLSGLRWDDSEKKIWTADISPLLSLLDVKIYRTSYDDLAGISLGAALETLVRELFIETDDSLQKIRGLVISDETPELTDWSLTSLDLLNKDADTDLNTSSVELWEIFLGAFRAYGIAAKMAFDLTEKEVCLTLYGMPDNGIAIESDAAYVIKADFDKNVSYGKVNKAVCISTTDQTQSITYYAKSDGTVTTDPDDPLRITPVRWKYFWVTKDNFEEQSLTMAKAEFESGQDSLSVALTVADDNRLIDVPGLEIGETVKIISRNTVYDTVLTGWEKTDERHTALMFGFSRTELTKKMMMEQRS